MGIMSLLCVHDIYLVHIHAIGVPKGVTLLEFEETCPEEPQQPTPEVQVVQPAGEVPDKAVIDCPDHVPCNFVKGKPWSIISLLPFEMQLSIMLYILLH
jgi:hypothetical protein